MSCYSYIIKFKYSDVFDVKVFFSRFMLNDVKKTLDITNIFIDAVILTIVSL